MGTLRLLLALAVAAGHLPLPAPRLPFAYPQTAVQAFFIISGFFIAMVLNENHGYRSTPRFYASRYLRLYPIYIVSAVATLLLNKYNVFSFRNFNCSYFECLGALRPASQFFVLFSNATMLFQDWFMFLQVNPQTLGFKFVEIFTQGTSPQAFRFLWAAQAWSLGVELLFYAIAPFVVRSPIRIGALILVALLSRYLSYRAIGGIVDPWYYRFAPSEMLFFGIGALSYHGWRTAAAARWVKRVGAAAMVLLIVATLFRLAFSHPSNFAPLMLVDPEFLLLFAILIPAVFQFTRQSRLDRMVGELSYPLYLSHMGVGAALSLWTPPNALTAYGVYFGSALLVSAGLLVVIDIPVSRLRAWLFGARQEPQSSPDPVLPIAAAA